MYRLHTTCRACSNESLESVFDLGVVPLANDFKTADADHAGYAPLRVLFCRACTLSQLSVVVDPKVLYQSYAYETSKSKTMREHFALLWQAIKSQGKYESVIEVGSNTGNFLEFVRENGADSVVGIDPAENLAAVANRNGITTVIGILDDHAADCASRVVTKPDVIVARHVFAHVDDWLKFMRNLDTLANRDTLIVIEVPYVVDTLDRAEFDNCYHEHLSYVSLKAMAVLLEKTPFRMQHVMRFTIHGGSIVIFIRRRDWGGDADTSVADAIESEIITPYTWSDFANASRDAIQDLKTVVRNENRKSGNTGGVVGYGSSAKSTVWISACGFTKKDIACIYDNTPWKQGRLSPGTDIPIVPETQFASESANVAICFAWNFMQEIKEKNAGWIARGGKFINPHNALRDSLP